MLYNKGIYNIRFNVITNKDSYCYIKDICKITTGKLDANAMVQNGKYRFYTCAKEHYFIDDYSFDTEALLISGNGANVGYIHYYKGKFNAYQRTYILYDFIENIKYIQLLLEKNLKHRIDSEKNTGNTPYIVLSTIADMKITLPNIQTQADTVNTISSVKKYIQLSNDKNLKLISLKKGLLQNMFV